MHMQILSVMFHSVHTLHCLSAQRIFCRLFEFNFSRDIGHKADRLLYTFIHLQTTYILTG